MNDHEKSVANNANVFLRFGFILASWTAAIQPANAETTGGETAFPYYLLVSGYVSQNVHLFDACTADYVANLTDPAAIPGAQAILAGPDGNLYVVSEESNSVLRFNAQTLEFIDAFVADDPNTPDIDETGGLSAPTGADFGPDGNLYVCGFNSDNVIKYDGQTGEFIEVFVSAGTAGMNGPDAGMIFGPDGNLYVPSFNSNAVLRFDGQSGEDLNPYIPAGAGGLSRPRVIIFRTESDDVLVSSWGNNSVRRYATDGTPLGPFVSPVTRPSGMAIGPDDGDLYVTSDNIDHVLRFSGLDGSPIDTYVPPGLGGLDAGTFLYFLPNQSPLPIGDGDADGDVDRFDFAQYLECLGLPDAPPPSSCCLVFDADGDADVDFADLAALQPMFMPPCGVAIVQQPQDFFACENESATFTIIAAGESLDYQWQFNGENIPNQTQPTLLIDPVGPDQLGQYRCIATDSCDDSVTSTAAELAIAPDAEITAHPTGGDYCVGATIALFVSATGAESFQWYKDDAPIPGATGSFLFIVATLEDTGTYHVDALGPCNTATSNDAPVQVTCGDPCPPCDNGP